MDEGVSELQRISTFSTWPGESRASVFKLAKCGFIYSGKNDEVTCCACKIRLSGWSADDDPLERHKQSSPDCPFLKGGAGVPNGNFGTNPECVGGSFTFHNDRTRNTQMADLYRTATERARRKGLFGEERLSNMNRSFPDFDKLRHEEERLRSFHDWPVSAKADPGALARAGFFYTGSGDRVQCTFCRGFVQNWLSTDLPEFEHKKHFPECLFVRGFDVGNVPIVTEPIASGNIPRNENGEQSWNTGFPPATNRQNFVRHPEPTPTPATQGRDFVNHPEPTPTPGQTQEFPFSPTTEPPRYPRYTELADRIDSFSSGYVSPGQTARGLAEAGWFYIGPGDKVLCFQCGGNLKDWEFDDNPWVEHEKWYPTCTYLLTYGPTARLPTSVSSTHFSRFNNVNQGEIIEARMDRPSIRSILDMGFPRDLVKSAIERRLLMTGDDFPNVESLLEELFRMQEEQLSQGPYNMSAISSALPSSQGTVESQQSAFRSLPPERPSGATTYVTPHQSMITAPSNEQAIPAASTTGTSAYGQNNNEQMEVEPADEEVPGYLQENRQLLEARTCKVCMDAQVDTVFLPCGHLVCCNSCSRHLSNCPICRQLIRGTVKTFLS